MISNQGSLLFPKNDFLKRLIFEVGVFFINWCKVVIFFYKKKEVGFFINNCRLLQKVAVFSKSDILSGCYKLK